MQGPVPEIEFGSPAWLSEPGAESCVREAVVAAATRVPAEGEISILLTDDACLQALNRDWRGIDRPTNVLSFPAAGQPLGSPKSLGDIAIAYETLLREAGNERKPVLHHLAHLVVHGFLHLMGYDHQTDSEADAMEALEREILSDLRIPDPYRAEAPDAA